MVVRLCLGIFLACVANVVAAQSTNLPPLACIPTIVVESATTALTPTNPTTMQLQVRGFWTGTSVQSVCNLEKLLPNGTWFPIVGSAVAPPMYYVGYTSFSWNVQVPKANSRYRLVIYDSQKRIIGTAYELTILAP